MLSKISIKTKSRNEFINISSSIQSVITKSGIKEGLCIIYIPHTTAGVTINEAADPAVVSDIINHLQKIVPFNSGYTHFEGNSSAHIKASLMGTSSQIPIQNGNLATGTWQGIFFCEFDGPRNRSILVQIIANTT